MIQMIKINKLKMILKGIVGRTSASRAVWPVCSNLSTLFILMSHVASIIDYNAYLPIFQKMKYVLSLIHI